MAEVPSSRILTLGSSAPEFTLPDLSGAQISAADARGPKGLVVAFICNHCPYVLHLANALRDFADNCVAKGVGFVAINSNDVSRYPADSPDNMKATKEHYGWDFPYLYDESQAVARAYFAACTPDFFLFDQELKLAYCGQFDTSRPNQDKPVTGGDLHEAVERMLSGRVPVEDQQPSRGCSIKWKPGNEPEWLRG